MIEFSFKKENILKKLCTITLSSLVLCGGVSVQAADVRGVILYDVTGSMNAARTGTNSIFYPTRCSYAKEIFKTKLVDFVARFAGSYLDVRTFAGPGSVTSLTGGSVNIGTMSSSQFASFNQNLLSQVDGLTCPGPSTAIGDAACEAMDSLKADYNTGDTLMLTFVTDGGENSSLRCGGGRNTYVDTHLKPYALQAPTVRVSTSILVSGNVNKNNTTEILETEASYFYSKAPLAGNSEIDSLQSLATETGGTFTLIYDGNGCEGDCTGINNGGPGEGEW